MNKPLIVFLHGWGMNRGIWQEVNEILNQDYDTLCLDLPGYGGSKKASNKADLTEITQLLAKQIPQNREIILIGWSLGGLIAIALTKLLSKQVKQLIMLTATPKFVQSEDWLYAVKYETFSQFLSQLQQNNHATIQRFIAIQVIGSPTANADRKKINHALQKIPYADQQTLEQGLELLLSLDLREQLAALNLPILFICGDRDTMVPKKAIEGLVQKQHNASMYMIKGAGHAPFISHVDEFVQVIKQQIESPLGSFT